MVVGGPPAAEVALRRPAHAFSRFPPAMRALRFLLPAAALLLLAAVGGWLWRRARPHPGALLERLAQTYQQASTFRERGRLVWRITVGGVTSMREQPYVFSFQRPDRFHYQVEAEEGRQLVVCDGERLFIQMATLPAVLQTVPPPEPLAALQQLQGGPSPGDAALISSLALLRPALPSVAEVAWMGTARWGGTFCHLVQVRFPRGGEETLWIGRSDGLLHAYRARLDPSAMEAILEGARAAARAGSSLSDEPLSQLLENVAIEIEVELDEIEINPPLDAAAFAYQAPAGREVRQVPLAALLGGAAADPGMAAAGSDEICLDHLERLAEAVRAYAREHEGRLPDHQQWAEAIRPYVQDERIFRCPAAGQQKEPHYQMSSRPQGLLASVEDPAGTILLFERTGNGRPSYRHPEGIGLAFVDGHVGRFEQGTVQGGMWSPEKGD